MVLQRFKNEDSGTEYLVGVNDECIVQSAEMVEDTGVEFLSAIMIAAVFISGFVCGRISKD